LNVTRGQTGASSHFAVPERTPWTLADVLDFESLLHHDELHSDLHELAERDSRLWRERIERTLQPDEHDEPRTVFHRWLESRRATDASGIRPGTWLANGWRALGYFATIAGLVAGTVVAGGALYYRGERPVNVAVFLGVTVGVQWLLLLWAGMLWVAGGFRAAASRTLAAFFDAIGRWLAAAMEHLSGEERQSLRGDAAALRNLAGRNSDLLRWPPLIALQRFGVAWNLGVLAALLLRVLATDVAFGWESTWAKGPGTTHAIAAALAAPWTWFAPAACPTLEQVEQSWFHYQSGMTALDRNAAAAWWTWLVGVIVTYGLLPRLLLLGWSAAKLRGCLHRVSFDEPRHKAAWMRLAGPVVRGTLSSDEPHLTHASTAVLASARKNEPGCLLVSTPLADARGEIEQWVQAQLGWKLAHGGTIEPDFPSGNEAELNRLAAALPQAPRWIIAVPAPFTAFAAFCQVLDTIARSARNGGKNEGYVLVVTREPDGCAAAPDEGWLRYWRDFLREEAPDVAVFAFSRE
jgi:hypothetical protein